MINPSASGWIDKFFAEQSLASPIQFENINTFYERTRANGFIFGHIVGFEVGYPIDFSDWVVMEKTKIGLLNTMYLMYRFKKPSLTVADFIAETISFYGLMTPKGFNPLLKMLPTASPTAKLEKILHDRVQTNEDLFSKNFSHVITNALLFIDVLAFKQYLEHGTISEKYFSKLEAIIMNVISLSLKAKTTITEYDDLLLKLFEASVRYNKPTQNKSINIDSLETDVLTNDLERFYVLDLAGISMWSDAVIENEERYFLHTLSRKLEVADDFIDKSIQFVDDFINTHKEDIAYFNNANPVKHFYDHTTETVKLLVTRNKKRLVKELVESKELMRLLAKSTVKDLDKDEKKKVKKQLLDICKSIPSLTIFLLPGGSLLLPLLIKFIPKMLPSAFNENIDD
jgi:hypothetical protein